MFDAAMFIIRASSIGVCLVLLPTFAYLTYQFLKGD